MIAHVIASAAMMANPPGHPGLIRPPALPPRALGVVRPAKGRDGQPPKGRAAPPATQAPDYVAMYERMLADGEAMLVDSRKRFGEAEARAIASGVRLNAVAGACYRAEQAFADFRRNYPAWEADPGIAADGRRLRVEATNAGRTLHYAGQSAHFDSWIAEMYRDSVEFSERHVANLRDTLERHRRDAGTRVRPAVPAPAPQRPGNR